MSEEDLRADGAPAADDYVARRQAKGILARNAARLAQIEQELIARIVGRIGAGENANIATSEEIQRALKELEAASIEVRKQLAALPRKVPG